jgi:hypothetical protein
MVENMEKPILKPFGEVAMEKGFVTLDQLLYALNIQSMDDRKKGEHRLIGSILREQGWLNNSQINEIQNFCRFIRINTTP